MPAPPAGHRAQLDTVRFLAFLGVFVFHCDEHAFAYGSLGVQLFFVLSGFLITRLLLLNETGSRRHDLAVFYARRTLRIFPLYYLVLVVLLLAGRLDHPWWHFLYLHNILMFLEPALTPGATGHFWSLSVEEQFYLLFPLVLLLTPGRYRVLLLLGLLVGSSLSRMTLHALFPESRYWALLPVQGQYLVWGCFAGLFDVAQRSRPVPVGPLLAAGLALHALASADQFGLLLGRPNATGLCPTLHGVGFALVVLALWLLPDGRLMRLLTLAPFVYLGKISYGLYVFHNFCYGVDVPLVEALPWLGVVPGPVLVFAVVVLLASLSWHLFEAPINRLKDWVPYRRGPLASPVRSAPVLVGPPVVAAAGGAQA
jgi:peptidoglycan/LPS O-acetylase OafA/YrhL